MECGGSEGVAWGAGCGVRGAGGEHQVYNGELQ